MRYRSVQITYTVPVQVVVTKVVSSWMTDEEILQETIDSSILLEDTLKEQVGHRIVNRRCVVADDTSAELIPLDQYIEDGQHSPKVEWLPAVVFD